MSLEVRPCTGLAEYAGATDAIGQYFGNEPDIEKTERFSRVLPIERMHAAWEDGQIVGGAGAFPFTMSVPGGSRPCGGTTVVGVLPTHRRRGILRSMMRGQLDDIHERGEPLAALWASEETIYGRFGYGPAAYAGEVNIPKEYVDFIAPREPSGTMRIVERDDALETFPPLWEGLARERPGMFMRSRDWWELRALRDPPERRRRGPKRLVLLEVDGRRVRDLPPPDGLGEGVSSGKVLVIEAMRRRGVGAGRAGAITRHRLGRGDLVVALASIRCSSCCADAAHALSAGELWVRLSTSGPRCRDGRIPKRRVRLRRSHLFCLWNKGRWARRAAERTNADADLALDVSTLGAQFGGIRFAQLAQGGQVESWAGRGQRADGIFRHGLHPWCPEIF